MANSPTRQLLPVRTNRGLLTVAFLLSSLLVPVSASSQAGSTQPTDEDIERAAEIYDNGSRLYDEGEYEAAIMAFEEAYNLSGYADLFYDIANAYERLGDLEHAIDFLNQFRAFAPEDERESLSRRVRSLERRLEASEADPADESSENTENTDTPLGDSTTGALDVIGESDAAREALLAARESDTGTGDTEEGDDPDGPVEVTPEPVLGTAEWALLGATGVALTTGIVFGVVATGQRDTFESGCVDVAGRTLCQESSDYDNWQRSALIADIGFGVAAASALTLGVLLLTSDGDEGDAPISATPLLTPNSAGVLLRSEF